MSEQQLIDFRERALRLARQAKHAVADGGSEPPPDGYLIRAAVCVIQLEEQRSRSERLGDLLPAMDACLIALSFAGDGGTDFRRALFSETLDAQQSGECICDHNPDTTDGPEQWERIGEEQGWLVNTDHAQEVAGLQSNAAAVREQHAARVLRLMERLDAAEAALAEEMRRAEAMQHERDDYATDNEAWRSEALRLRARVRVTGEDIERAGVTRAKCEAWALARRGVRLDDTFPDDPRTWLTAIDGVIICLAANPDDLAERWDILDEMAMAVPS